MICIDYYKSENRFYILLERSGNDYFCLNLRVANMYIWSKHVSKGLHIFHTEHNLAVPVLPALMRHLKAMGLEMRTCNAEYGTGQYELTFGEQEGVIAADHAYTFKQAVKAIAKQLGYHASFMTKPFLDQSASGAHAHISLWDTQGQNIFLDRDNPHGLSQLACYAIAGMLAHAPAAAALLSPTPNCWSSLASGSCPTDTLVDN